MENLRAIFTAGPQSHLAAQEFFANRISEIEAFDESVRAFALWRPDTPSPVVDVSQGRHNVLVYFGTGGIGKTSLSQHLERRRHTDAWFRGRRESIEKSPRCAAVRVDFGESGVVDLETFVLRLRSGAARLVSRDPTPLMFRHSPSAT